MIGPCRRCIAGEQRHGAAVSEQRRADGLGLRIFGGGAGEDAAHPLGGHDQRVPVRVSCIVWAASRISGTALAQPTPLMWYLSVLGSIS